MEKSFLFVIFFCFALGVVTGENDAREKFREKFFEMHNKQAIPEGARRMCCDDLCQYEGSFSRSEEWGQYEKKILEVFKESQVHDLVCCDPKTTDCLYINNSKEKFDAIVVTGEKKEEVVLGENECLMSNNGAKQAIFLTCKSVMSGYLDCSQIAERISMDIRETKGRFQQLCKEVMPGVDECPKFVEDLSTDLSGIKKSIDDSQKDILSMCKRDMPKDADCNQIVGKISNDSRTVEEGIFICESVMPKGSDCKGLVGKMYQALSDSNSLTEKLDLTVACYPKGNEFSVLEMEFNNPIFYRIYLRSIGIESSSSNRVDLLRTYQKIIKSGTLMVPKDVDLSKTFEMESSRCFFELDKSNNVILRCQGNSCARGQQINCEPFQKLLNKKTQEIKKTRPGMTDSRMTCDCWRRYSRVKISFRTDDDFRFFVAELKYGKDMEPFFFELSETIKEVFKMGTKSLSISKIIQEQLNLGKGDYEALEKVKNIVRNNKIVIKDEIGVTGVYCDTEGCKWRNESNQYFDIYM